MTTKRVPREPTAEMLTIAKALSPQLLELPALLWRAMFDTAPTINEGGQDAATREGSGPQQGRSPQPVPPSPDAKPQWRMGIHWDDCATDGGPRHYDCAVAAITDLRAENARLRAILAELVSLHDGDNFHEGHAETAWADARAALAAPAQGEPRKFRKRPVVITAVQSSGELIETLEGTMRADPGDWIITGVKGERYPCKPDIFAATYEPVDAAPAPPVAQPAEPPATDDDGTPLTIATTEVVHVLRNPYGYVEAYVRAIRCEAADLIERQAREIAAAKADRNTYDAAHKRQAAATLEQLARAERAEAERDAYNEKFQSECGKHDETTRQRREAEAKLAVAERIIAAADAMRKYTDLFEREGSESCAAAVRALGE